MRVWDATTGVLNGKPLEHDKRVESVAFNSDAARVVTASGNVARVWDTTIGKPIGEPMLHELRVRIAGFSLDGTRVVTVSGSEPGTEKRGGTIGVVQVWDWATGAPFGKPLKQKRPIHGAVFSPNGARVLITSGNAAFVWDPATGTSIGKRMQHMGGQLGPEDWVTGGAFSPDGARVVTTSSDYTARLWDAETGAPIGKPMRHDDVVNAAAFSTDGARIVTASRDTTARVWDATTGAPIGQPLRHADEVKSAVFSLDGAHIVTASGNTARVWNAPPVAPNIISTACKMLGNNHGTADLSARYGIDVKDPICAQDPPAPDPSRMIDR